MSDPNTSTIVKELKEHTIGEHYVVCTCEMCTAVENAIEHIEHLDRKLAKYRQVLAEYEVREITKEMVAGGEGDLFAGPGEEMPWK